MNSNKLRRRIRHIDSRGDAVCSDMFVARYSSTEKPSFLVKCCKL